MWLLIVDIFIGCRAAHGSEFSCFAVIAMALDICLLSVMIYSCFSCTFVLLIASNHNNNYNNNNTKFIKRP